MKGSLKRKVVSGSLWNLVGSSGYQVIGLVIFIILSRILTPADFGTVALAIAFLELINIVVQFGLIEVLIREKILEEGVKNTIFWVSLILGGCGSILMFLLAPIVGSFFQAEGLEDVMIMLCIVPFLYSLNTVPEALLKRNFEFKPLAYRILVTTTVAGIIAIAMALNGFGLHSLVFQRVSSVLLVAIILWVSIDWRPSFSMSIKIIRRQVRQGWTVMLTTTISLGVLRTVEIMVGLFLGPAAVGYLKIAGKLHDFVFQLCIKPLVDVSLSAFSAIKPTEQSLGRTYLNFIQVCAIFSFPAFLGFAAISPEIVTLVFGEKWLMSGVVMQVVCLSCVSSALNYFFSPLVISQGRSGLALRIKMVELIIIAGAVLIASQYSLLTVVWASVIVSTLTTLQMLWCLERVFKISFRSVVTHILPGLLTSAFMGSLIFVIKGIVLEYFGVPVGLGVLVILGGLSYFLLMYVFFRDTAKKVSSLGLSLIKKVSG